MPVRVQVDQATGIFFQDKKIRPMRVSIVMNLSFL